MIQSPDWTIETTTCYILDYLVSKMTISKQYTDVYSDVNTRIHFETVDLLLKNPKIVHKHNINLLTAKLDIVKKSQNIDSKFHLIIVIVIF